MAAEDSLQRRQDASRHLAERLANSLHQIVSCPFKENAEVPSVPAQPGTSSLPTWPPRQLCHWRRTAAVGTAASPPPAAPLWTPPAAFEGPAALSGSLQAAQERFTHKPKQIHEIWEINLSVSLTSCCNPGWCPLFPFKFLQDKPVSKVLDKSLWPDLSTPNPICPSVAT